MAVRRTRTRDSDGAILHIAQFWRSTPDSIEPLRKHGTAFHGSGHTTPWERVSDVIRCAGLRRDSQRLVDVVQGDALPHARLGASQWRWIAMVRDVVCREDSVSVEDQRHASVAARE